MARRSLPALLAISTIIFFSCRVIGRKSSQIYPPKMPYRNLFYVCRNSGLTQTQKQICSKNPDTTVIALDGLKSAVKECQFQFRNDRWNCSSFKTKSENPFKSAIFHLGFRETAYVHALSTAGVVIAVAKGCSQNQLTECACDINRRRYKRKKDAAAYWKRYDGGDNLKCGLNFSRMFLDPKKMDFRNAINLHNNKVGRREVKANMVQKCTCHGISGSCTAKTCWLQMPNIRQVAEKLKQKYHKAVFVQRPNKANKHQRPHKKKPKHLRKELVLKYFEKSPTYCERDDSLGIYGTYGRHCSANASSADSCEIMCCGRGYDKILGSTLKNNCTFTWCCTVNCIETQVPQEIRTCK